MEIQVPDNWRPRDYQLDLWKYLENGGKRAVPQWHTPAGKDLQSVKCCVTTALKRKG